MKIDYGWKPRQSDIDWTRNLFCMLAEGGMWAIPANQSVWKLDKARSLITCIKGGYDDMFHKITVCCKAFGYSTALTPSPEDVKVFLSGGSGKSHLTQFSRN